ncbi:hypothetical protein ACP4OV_027800 [Aristida adscensionis]
MRRTAALLSRLAGAGAGGRGIPQALSDVLVCPLSKTPLRYCEASGSLVSDAVGVSFPDIIDGIPSLVPKDGRFLEDHQQKSEESTPRDPSG